jgi:hypothetical protein
MSLEVDESTAELSVKLVESTGDICYVAISHVWADGLGNPFGNALPKCQLIGLQNLAKGVVQASGLDVPALLWLDTICVPCKPGAGKTIAMGMMRRTYEEADHVLVLESSLRSCDTESSDLIEIGVRIFTSPWLRRLWCLQEGALAKRLWFQFQDRPVDLAEIFGKFRAVYHSRNISQMELVFNMSAIWRSLRLFEKDPQVTTITLQKVVRALQYRGVSVASDEPICLVNLFDIDAKILNEQDGSPMSRFWHTLCGIRLVPRTILFFKGPKLEDEGFRWAPSTLLGAGHLLPDYQEPAVLDKNGLRLHFPGVVIHRPVFDIITLIMNKRQALPDVWYLLDQRTGRWYGIIIKSTDVQTCIFGENDGGESQLKMLKDGKGKDFAIICSHDPNPQKGTQRNGPPNAMFISIKAHEDGVYYGRIQGEVLFTTSNLAECALFNRAKDIAQSMSRVEFLEGIVRINDMEESKRSETLSPIVDSLLVRIRQAAKEALEEPNFRRIHDANFLHGSDQLVLVIWKLYITRFILVDGWLPDDTVWCLD